jgi:multiple sugar transport system substrate-binding protein
LGNGLIEPLAFRSVQRVSAIDVRRVLATSAAIILSLLLTACGPGEDPGIVLTFPASALGAEARLLESQLARFMEARPDIRVVPRRTPDAADQRHQLYVQWLNGRAGDPDILQLDVIWTPEFAAAGWLLPLDRFRPPADSFLPATIRANRWGGELYALPWFVDAGMLYWRNDLLERPPATLDELARLAREARGRGGPASGYVWQGARYEGLVTVFQEVLGGFGGRIMDDSGRIVVNSPAGQAALTWLREAVSPGGFSPTAVLTWQEEEVRFAFQNGQALFMRNWPYAYALMNDSTESRVARRFAVAPVPGSVPGRATAALGGQQLAINAHTEHPEAAFALIAFLTAPEQMLERAEQVGQYPTRFELYDDPRLAKALPIPPAEARRIVERAEPRPVTPVYTELSGVLQIWLHRTLTGQATPDEALDRAATEMRDLLQRVGLTDAP